MVDPLFQVHMLNDIGKQKATEIAGLFDKLLSGLKAFCPESREFSIVKTDLERACFFAKKAMANSSENQQ